jgi:hypothetical protein
MSEWGNPLAFRQWSHMKRPPWHRINTGFFTAQNSGIALCDFVPRDMRAQKKRHEACGLTLNQQGFTPYQGAQKNVGHNKTTTRIIVEASMVKIECDPEGGFSVVEGYDEFLELMDKKGTVEVADTSTGRHYFAHEVGSEIYLLNQASQDALTSMADMLIQSIIKKSLH